MLTRSLLRTCLFVLLLSVLSALVITPVVYAAESYELQGVALHRKGESWKKWGWFANAIEKRTEGQLSMKSTKTYEEFGLKGTEVLRLLKSGIIDVTEFLPGYVGGDLPLVEATEFPGVTISWNERRDMFSSWAENVVAPREDLIGGKVIGTFCWNSILLFSKFPVNNLEDLKGKKIRVFATSQAQYLRALGAEPVSMPVSEVYGALQRGIIEGVVTGSDQVKGMKLWEITSNMTDLGFPPLGSYIVVSNKSWNKLPVNLQKALKDIGQDLTNIGWQLGLDNDEIGRNLAAEKGMTIVPLKDEWKASLNKITQETILPGWVKQTGDDGKKAFDSYLAPVVGFSTN